MRHCDGKWWLTISLIGGLLSGCATAPRPSPYRVAIPELQAHPTDYQVGAEWYRCYRRDDAIALVQELKAACLATGGTPEACQTVLPAAGTP